jgi:hypothetical protein
MKNLCMLYLLLKSMFNRTFTVFDVLLAGVLIDTTYGEKHSFLAMIANLSGPNKLPEAWADFLYEARESLNSL